MQQLLLSIFTLLALAPDKSNAPLPVSVAIYKGEINFDQSVEVNGTEVGLNMHFRLQVIDSCFSTGEFTLVKRGFSNLDVTGLGGGGLSSGINYPKRQTVGIDWERGVVITILDNEETVAVFPKDSWRRQRGGQKVISSYATETWKSKRMQTEVSIMEGEASLGLRPAVPGAPVNKGGVVAYRGKDISFTLLKTYSSTYDMQWMIRKLKQAKPDSLPQKDVLNW